MKIPKGYARVKTGQSVKPGDWQLIDKSCDLNPVAKHEFIVRKIKKRLKGGKPS
jgi:hypothetical protein